MAGQMPAERVLLDMMAITCLNEPDTEEKIGTKTGKELDAECERAGAIYAQKYFVLRKGQKVEQLKRSQGGYKPRRKMSVDESNTIKDLERKLNRLSSQEKSLEDDLKKFHANGLPHLIIQNSKLLVEESKVQKECKKLHNLACFQAELLQILSDVVELDQYKRQYTDKLSNSVLTGSYDFLNEL